MASFPSYYSLILGPGAIPTFGELRGAFMGTSSKLTEFIHSGQFYMLLLTDFGSRGDTNVQVTSVSNYGELVKTRRFYTLWPGLYAITH